ncbi:MliC family protein [Aestuariirhabdus sp. LZHN29]|uniref:MliC family protein n=1 Tax=Aestuariirhabdus sp. LZHN29 TaxID=3417462 RepID=UPI003CED4F91
MALGASGLDGKLSLGSWLGRRGVALLGGVLLAGCALVKPVDPGWAESASPANTWVYRCDKGFDFVARGDGERVWLFLPQSTVALNRMLGGSGERYLGDGLSFWRKGEEATLASAGQTYLCQNDRRAAIWEASKLNGFDYRAAGNEPGWYLEIGQGVMSHLVTGYGETRIEFRLPAPQTDQAARVTVYRLPKERLQIRIEAKPCSDTMSGESFASSVRVMWDGQSFSGCGRALH